MFKVSFKDTDKNYSKYVVVVGREVKVVLSGIILLPPIWQFMPNEIRDWLLSKTTLDYGEEDLARNSFHVRTVGKASCHENDSFDYILGERIAESRAKIKLYTFLYKLCYRFYEYYCNILFGTIVVDIGCDNCLANDIKKYESLLNKEKKHLEQLLRGKEDE